MPEIGDQGNFDRAVDFALGLLSEEEESALLLAARDDPELEKMLRQQCAAQARARAEGTSDLQETRSRRFPVRSASSVRNFKRWPTGRRLAMTTAALAVVVALFLLARPKPHSDEFWLPVDPALTTTRSSSGPQVQWREGLKLYSQGRLEEAIRLLESADLQGAAADLRDLYLASAELNVGHGTDARKILDRIDIDTLPYPWRDYARELARRIHPVQERVLDSSD